MPLDVCIVDDPNRDGLSGERPVMPFDEAVHEFVFFGTGIDVDSRFASLRRMIDDDADASFSGAALPAVVTEIDELLPHVAASAAAVETLTRFQSICRNASAGGKLITLFCD